MLYRIQVNVAPRGNVGVWSFVRPTAGEPYTFQTHEEARRMAAICYPLEHSHACRIALEIEPLDVGTIAEGLGVIQGRDVGKLGFARPGGMQWENDAQRDARKGARPDE